MNNQSNLFYYIVLFMAMFIITFVEALSDIKLGLYHKGRKPRYYHAIIPALPWGIVGLIAYLTISFRVNSLLAEVVFLLVSSFFAFIISQVLYKYPNVILLFFCIILTSIVSAKFLYEDTFVGIEHNIKVVETIKIEEKKIVAGERLDERIEKFTSGVWICTGGLLTVIGVCMGILWKTPLLKKPSALRAELYSIIIAIGSLFAFGMIFFWFIKPLHRYSDQLYSLLYL